MKLPTMKYRRYRGDMIELYKLSHGLYDLPAENSFIHFRDGMSCEQHTRNHNFNIFKERFSKDIGKYCFKGRVTDQWNNLPKKLVNSPSLNQFKKQLDALWEDEGVMYDPQVDIILKTSERKTRYAIIKE